MHRWQKQRFRRVLFGFLLSFCLFMTLGAWLHPAQAQINQATVTEVLDGNQVFIQGRPARVNSTAGMGQQVSTGSSRAGLRFNNGAAGRLRPNTSLVIGQCIQIQQGGIIASGPTNACAGSVRAATRGTTFLMEVQEDGTYGCKVLEGSVAMTPIDPQNPDQFSHESEFILEEGKKISISKEGEIGQPEAITIEDIQSILSGSFFSGFTEQLPGGGNLQRALQQLFPGIPLPNLGLPNLGIPSLPIPRIPRFPL